jgi:hypothetical protein
MGIEEPLEGFKDSDLLSSSDVVDEAQYLVFSSIQNR